MHTTPPNTSAAPEPVVPPAKNAESTAPIDYDAMVQEFGFVPSKELTSLVAQRHFQLLNARLVLQCFQHLQRERDKAERAARKKEGGNP